MWWKWFRNKSFVTCIWIRFDSTSFSIWFVCCTFSHNFTTGHIVLILIFITLNVSVKRDMKNMDMGCVHVAIMSVTTTFWGVHAGSESVESTNSAGSSKSSAWLSKPSVCLCIAFKALRPLAFRCEVSRRCGTVNGSKTT